MKTRRGCYVVAGAVGVVFNIAGKENDEKNKSVVLLILDRQLQVANQKFKQQHLYTLRKWCIYPSVYNYPHTKKTH